MENPLISATPFTFVAWANKNLEWKELKRNDGFGLDFSWKVERN